MLYEISPNKTVKKHKKLQNLPLQDSIYGLFYEPAEKAGADLTKLKLKVP